LSDWLGVFADISCPMNMPFPSVLCQYIVFLPCGRWADCDV
jgi:hypothetical protein